MIVKENGVYETNSMFPSINWYIDEQNYIIDETTEQGKSMMQTYIDNYPLVTFINNGEFVTSVSVIELERPIELIGKRIELIKNELSNWEYIYVDIPLTKEQELENEIASLRAMIENLVGGVE